MTRSRSGRRPRPIRIAVQIDQQHTDQLLELGTSLFVIEYASPPYDLAQLAPWLRWREERNAPGP